METGAGASLGRTVASPRLYSPLATVATVQRISDVRIREETRVGRTSLCVHVRKDGK